MGLSLSIHIMLRSSAVFLWVRTASLFLLRRTDIFLVSDLCHAKHGEAGHFVNFSGFHDACMANDQILRMFQLLLCLFVCLFILFKQTGLLPRYHNQMEPSGGIYDSRGQPEYNVQELLGESRDKSAPMGLARLGDCADTINARTKVICLQFQTHLFFICIQYGKATHEKHIFKTSLL